MMLLENDGKREKIEKTILLEEEKKIRDVDSRFTSRSTVRKKHEHFCADRSEKREDAMNVDKRESQQQQKKNSKYKK